MKALDLGKEVAFRRSKQNARSTGEGEPGETGSEKHWGTRAEKVCVCVFGVTEEEERKWGARKETGELCLGFGGAGQSGVGAGGEEGPRWPGKRRGGRGEGRRGAPRGPGRAGGRAGEPQSPV